MITPFSNELLHEHLIFRVVCYAIELGDAVKPSENTLVYNLVFLESVALSCDTNESVEFAGQGILALPGLHHRVGVLLATLLWSTTQQTDTYTQTTHLISTAAPCSINTLATLK